MKLGNIVDQENANSLNLKKTKRINVCFTEKMNNQLKYIKLFNHFHAKEIQL